MGYVRAWPHYLIKHLKEDFGLHNHDNMGVDTYKAMALHYGLPTRASKKAARAQFLKAIAKQGGKLAVPDNVKAIRGRLFFKWNERYAQRYGHAGITNQRGEYIQDVTLDEYNKAEDEEVEYPEGDTEEDGDVVFARLFDAGWRLKGDDPLEILEWASDSEPAEGVSLKEHQINRLKRAMLRLDEEKARMHSAKTQKQSHNPADDSGIALEV